MKKFFVKAALIISAITMSLGMTSCNEDTLKVLTGILEQVLAGQNTSVTFTGTMKAGAMMWKGEDGYVWLQKDGHKTEFRNIECKMVLSTNKTTQHTTASLSLPAFEVDGCKASAIALAKLDVTTTATYSTFDLGDEIVGDATLTVGGTDYPLTSLYVYNEKDDNYRSMITADNKVNYIIQVYYGESRQYVVEIEYSGEAPLQEV